MKRFRFLVPIVVIVVGMFIVFTFIYSQDPVSLFKNLFSSTMADPMEQRVAPEIRGITGWLNSEPLTLAELRGNVVLIDFWTYSCINCRRDMPFVNGWHEKYADQGLVVIGVHTPEFRYEEKRENVEAAIAELGISFPVAQDNNYQTWRAYHNLYWPSKYLIDRQGTIVYRSIGEGNYQTFEQKIIELLQQP